LTAPVCRESFAAGEMTEMNHRGTDEPAVGSGTSRHDGAGGLGAGNQRQLDRTRPSFTMLQVDVVNPIH
jgi:hypothetical protein